MPPQAPLPTVRRFRGARSWLLPACLLIMALAMLWHSYAVPALAARLEGPFGALSTPLALLLSFVAGGALLYALLRTRAARAAVAFGEYRLQLRLLADELPIGVVTAAGDRVVFVNRTALRQIGRDEDAELPRSAAELLGTDAASALAMDAPFDGSLPLPRRDAADPQARFNARVRARTVALGARRLRLLLIDDLTERDRINAQLAQQHEELQAMARRLMTLQEDERHALSRELHDDVGQAITAIKLCALTLPAEDDADARAEAAGEIAEIADQTLVKLRNLSLLLRPPQLDALGLEAALRGHAGTVFRSSRPQLRLALTPLPQRPDPNVELACFRIAQEALTNVLRHARAERVTLSLQADAQTLVLRVEDDGCGIDSERLHGLGLLTMRERAQQVGGRLSIDSDDGGTRIRAELPMGARGATY